MNKVALSMILLIFASSSAHALTTKQKREQQHLRHEHMHKLHQENKILNKWMATSEKNCSKFQGNEFHICYIKSMNELHEKSNIKLSSETEKMFKGATKPPRNTLID